ncbi:MAG TPA: NINE protein [Candidatus Angelobacter sp.]|nr:NINE protein [Candidatus Angelobacter sp.]
MSEPVCPYCRMPFDEAAPPKIFCTACGMPHHEDCYRENGGCTVFGCKCAPADDPKVQVSQSDLSAIPTAQPYSAVPQSYAAPQYPSSAYSGPLGLSQAAAPAPAQVPASAPYAPAAYQPYAAPAGYGRSQKTRTTYIVLGIFLGALGVHNFYAGYVGRAVGQLCLTVLTLGYLGIISWIWAIIEICIVEKDSTGLNFS